MLKLCHQMVDAKDTEAPKLSGHFVSIYVHPARVGTDSSDGFRSI